VCSAGLYFDTEHRTSLIGMKLSNKTKLLLINAGLIIGFIAIVVIDFFGRLLQKSSPYEEWTSIFSKDAILGYLPEFIFLGLVAIFIAVITARGR